MYVGSTSLNGNGKTYELDKAIKHRSHNKPMFANDIGVLRVKEQISFNKNVQPIEPSSQEPPHGSSALLTGWGRLGVSYTVKIFCYFTNLSFDCHFIRHRHKFQTNYKCLK